MRILAGGHKLEDIGMYNRVHEMFSTFSATDSRENAYGEGFPNFLGNPIRRLSYSLQTRLEEVFLLLNPCLLYSRQ